MVYLLIGFVPFLFYKKMQTLGNALGSLGLSAIYLDAELSSSWACC